MSRYRFSPQARQDLNDIYDYIAQHNAAAAARLVAAIKQRCQQLANTPGMGRACGHLAAGLRLSSVRGYNVFFRPGTGGVQIIRILHGARDYRSLFRP